MNLQIEACTQGIESGAHANDPAAMGRIYILRATGKAT